MIFLIRTRLFLRMYWLFPHRLFNTLTAWVMTTKRPRWLVRTIIKRWIKTKGIKMEDFEELEYQTVEEFFLRQLKPGARPLHDGFVSPVDGNLMAQGTIEKDTILQVKGQPISITQMVNSKCYSLPLEEFEGGSYLTIFLTPNGYHRLHMPSDATIQSVQWIPGRTFPQNEVAVHHIPRIYERNERAVLSCTTPEGEPFLMTLVGASLIGGIHLTGIPRQTWVNTQPTNLSLPRHKGDEFAHFSFGSTIVLLFPNTIHTHFQREIGDRLLLGECLFSMKV